MVEGRRRKYYSATAAGEAVLMEAREKIRELVNEVLEEVPVPEVAPGALLLPS